MQKYAPFTLVFVCKFICVMCALFNKLMYGGGRKSEDEIRIRIQLLAGGLIGQFDWLG